MHSGRLLVSSLIPWMVLSGAAAADPSSDHPFLFLTREDVDRVRTHAAPGAPFEALAREWSDKARSRKIDELPDLERAWWEEARKKPWGDVYPEVFHHTWIVPQQWSDLAVTCARASLLEPELATRGREVLLQLADYTFEFEHYDVGMNYTVWGMQALEAYDILHDGFSEGGRKRLDGFFRRMVEAVEKNDRYWVEHEPGGALNNHYAWHKLGMAALGLFYGRGALVEKALRGPKGVFLLMEHGFTDDGLWLEGSIPYQLAATAPLVKLAELLENAGYPTKLWGHETGDGYTLEGAYDALFGLLLPDRTLPPVGDSYARRPHLGTSPDWEILYRRLREPRYAWLLADQGDRSPRALFFGLPELPAAEPPAQLSRLWPGHGYVALRSAEGPDYWTGRGWTVFATYGSNPVHANADKLSILLFADGHLWLPDCEAKTGAEHAFSARVQSELNRATLCHNALLVDGRSQRPPDRRLDLIEYRVLPEARRFTIADLAGRLYPGVSQMRTCVVRDEYVLDFLQVASNTERDLAWCVHVDGSPSASSVETKEPFELPDGPPWKYLRDPRRAGVSGRFWEVFRHGGNGFRVDLRLDGDGEIVTCGFPIRDTGRAGSLPMRMVRVLRASTWFAAVYRCGESLGEGAEVTVERGVLDTWSITVRLDGRTWKHAVPRLGLPQAAGGMHKES